MGRRKNLLLTSLQLVLVFNLRSMKNIIIKYINKWLQFSLLYRVKLRVNSLMKE